jgi:hypothetical protein
MLDMFDVELSKHKQHIEVIHNQRLLLEVLNANTFSGHVFNHLHNCPIKINLVVDPQIVHSLIVEMVDKNAL